MSAPRVSIGDVVVRDGEPTKGNPWLDPDSNERFEALHRAREGGDISAWTFWHVPYGRPSRRLADPRAEIDWSGLSARRATPRTWPYRADGSPRRDPTDI